MKTSKFYLAFTALIFAAIVFIISCKKKQASINETDLTGASEYCLAEQMSDDVTNMAGEVSEGVDNSYNGALAVNLTYTTSASAIVTHDTTHKIISVNFQGVACPDGHVRAGTLIFNYSQSPAGAKYFRNPGFTMVVSSSDYFDNGNAIKIHKSIVNTTQAGFNPSTTNLTWTVIDTVTIIEPGDSIVTISGTQVKTLLNTNDTTVYHGQGAPITWSLARMGNTSTGNLSGTDSEGQLYVAMITTNSVTSAHGLIRDFTCSPSGSHPADHPFILGMISITPGAEDQNLIDYSYSNGGAGACDKLYSIDINGHLYYLISE